MTIRFAEFLCGLACAPLLSAQTEWAEVPSPGNRDYNALVWDPVTNRVMSYGGRRDSFNSSDTLEWTGSEWLDLEPANLPPGRVNPFLAADLARRRVVMFGGRLRANTVVNSYSDTWEFDGSSWIRQNPANSPPAGFSFWGGMAYDSRRQRTVIVVGGTTWEWDGVDWQQRQVIPQPPDNGSLAFDPVRGVCVYVAWNGSATGTWEWDGATWTQQAPTAQPWQGQVVFDPARARIVDLDRSGAVWEWDGISWTRVSTQALANAAPRIAADPLRRRIVGYGDVNGVGQVTSRTWEWDGLSWSLRDQGQPSARRWASTAYDSARNRFVLFGGDFAQSPLDDTWEWDGSRWVRHELTTRPWPVQEALVFDAARGVCVLFGGTVAGREIDDHWQWDGAAWTQLRPNPRPAARTGHVMAYDSSRRVVVLYGGIDWSMVRYYDTWEWDGSRWTRMSPGSAPRFDGDMVFTYDAARREALLVGRSSAAGPMPQTWVWDGNTWTQRSPANPPGIVGPLTYDSARERAVMYDRTTLEWDGIDWRPRTTTTGPFGRAGHAYDTRRHLLVAYGGEDPLAYHDRMFVYGPVQPAAYTPFGTGCPGSNGRPTIRAARLPWLGDSLAVEIGNLRPHAPLLLLFGTSTTTWAGRSLPLPLGSFGLPGCLLYTDVQVIAAATANASGVATARFPICTCRSLVGARLFQQALVADPGSNPAGALTSNASEIIVGSR